MKHFYITTPIYYVNDKPHIGHAYTSLLCDVYSRFMKMAGQKVKFTTGTDEHGQKIEKAAKAKGMSAQDFTDKISTTFKELSQLMNFQYNHFLRTTDLNHKKAVTALWKRLEERNQIYLSSYSGWYSIRDEAFYQESELINGKAPTGAEVEWVKEESYFFRLSSWQNKLLDLYQDQPNFIFPESRKNEVVSFVESGLTDLSVSRTSFNWGIKVPGNDKHVIYVWIDALTNYITSVGFPNIESNEYKQFWADKNSFNIHVIGKDILRFHAVYWPAILMAADLPLPKQIAVHGWWLNEGEKISKSLGNTIDPIAIAKEFGTDQLRYFLLRETSFGQDGNFSMNNMVSRINAELANNIGNLVQRTLSFLYKQYSGDVPVIDYNLLTDNESLPDCKVIFEKITSYLQQYEFNRIILLIISISSEANAYIDKRAPWKMDKELMKLVIYKLLEYIRIIGILLQPIVPASANKILNQLQIPIEQRSLECLCNNNTQIKSINKPEPIFPRFDQDYIMKNT
ncbi:MAG: methionine--tRNA ligase [Wolbachia endosymbiont of Fragariocoptes setiger]|nr:methionine--tRNA ligase [Wolbachia endosymbiont of Fragariocoptes setiger]